MYIDLSAETWDTIDHNPIVELVDEFKWFAFSKRADGSSDWENCEANLDTVKNR